MAELAENASVVIKVEVKPELTAEVDEARLRQAVDNVLDNALRYAPPGTEVEVRARLVDEALVIEVTDQGPGFPPEFLAHAFERFRRADAGRAREHGGAGLGLAIVQAIATAHGGHASARNRTGAGAVVTILLPQM